MSDSEHIISGNSKSTRLGPFHLQITHALLAELLMNNILSWFR